MTTRTCPMGVATMPWIEPACGRPWPAIVRQAFSQWESCCLAKIPLHAVAASNVPQRKCLDHIASAISQSMCRMSKLTGRMWHSTWLIWKKIFVCLRSAASPSCNFCDSRVRRKCGLKHFWRTMSAQLATFWTRCKRKKHCCSIALFPFCKTPLWAAEAGFRWQPFHTVI